MGIGGKNMEERLIEGDEIAPDFVLKDHKGQEFRLSDFKGKKVLLSFHPLAWTSVCAQQMQSLDRHWNDFRELNTIAVGVNVDPVPSKKAWADFIGIQSTRLLSDFWPHGDIAKLYEVFREEDGFSERANIIINEDGKIEFVKIYEIGQLPDIKEILTLLGKPDKKEIIQP
jgi:peroxiredoxin